MKWATEGSRQKNFALIMSPASAGLVGLGARYPQLALWAIDIAPASQAGNESFRFGSNFLLKFDSKETQPKEK